MCLVMMTETMNLTNLLMVSETVPQQPECVVDVAVLDLRVDNQS